MDSEPIKIIEHDFTQVKPEIENVPEYARERLLKRTCIHRRLYFDEKNRRLECRDCGNDVDAWTILLRYMHYDWKLDHRVAQIQWANEESDRKRKRELRWPTHEMKRSFHEVAAEHAAAGCPRAFMWMTRLTIYCYCGNRNNRKLYPELAAEVLAAQQIRLLKSVKSETP